MNLSVVDLFWVPIKFSQLLLTGLTFTESQRFQDYLIFKKTRKLRKYANSSQYEIVSVYSLPGQKNPALYKVINREDRNYIHDI